VAQQVQEAKFINNDVAYQVTDYFSIDYFLCHKRFELHCLLIYSLKLILLFDLYPRVEVK